MGFKYPNTEEGREAAAAAGRSWSGDAALTDKAAKELKDAFVAMEKTSKAGGFRSFKDLLMKIVDSMPVFEVFMAFWERWMALITERIDWEVLLETLEKISEAIEAIAEAYDKVAESEGAEWLMQFLAGVSGMERGSRRGTGGGGTSGGAGDEPYDPFGDMTFWERVWWWVSGGGGGGIGGIDLTPGGGGSGGGWDPIGDIGDATGWW